jgi:CheY-like chemotaxis protein
MPSRPGLFCSFLTADGLIEFSSRRIEKMHQESSTIPLAVQAKKMVQIALDNRLQILTLMNYYKTLIIDDEWLIRAELKQLLLQYPNIHVVAEAANVTDAIRLYDEFKPDLVFLDIQLPGGSGFDFLEQVGGRFKLVFITAFDQYLKDAKSYQAIDYLMKPINKKKLSKVIQKL